MKNSDEISRFSLFLEKEKHRLTNQRLEVLQQVLQTEGHFDIETIIETIRRKRLRVSRATIYRTLGYLEKSNLIQRVHTGNGRHFFERVFGKKQHEHIHCLRCGKTVEFCDASIENRVDAISQRNGFVCANYAFQIFGMCSDCKKRLEA